MDRTKEAEERLRCYESKKRALTAIPRQMQEIRLRRESVRSAQTDGTAVRGGAQREEMLADSMDHEENLRMRLELTRLWVEEVEDALSRLSEEDQQFLDCFYIHPRRGNVERLARALFVERTTIYRYKNRALAHFADALYNWGNEID